MKQLFQIGTILILSILFVTKNSIAQQNVTGIWKGYLHTTASDSLTIVIEVIAENDSVRVELDSPDKYSFENIADHFSFSGDTFHFRISNIKYDGILDVHQQRISGTFIEGKFKAPLTFERTEKRDLLIRPQKPIPPFDYHIDDQISIYDPAAQQVVVNGTLTCPKSAPPKATVVLISGTGWQDRDETLFGHKPFWVIADDLTKKGYAVFRYDDLPQALFVKSSTYDFAKYLDMIIDHLKKDERCKSSPIGLLGHSEGSMIAFISASKNRNINFVISLAGVAQPYKEITLFQLEKYAMKDELEEAEKEKMLKIYRPIYEIIEKSKDNKEALKELGAYFDQLAKELTEEEKVKYNLTPKEMLGIRGMPLSSWAYNLYKIDAKRNISKTKCPIYALNGEMDTQVPYQNNLPLFQEYAKKNPLNRFESFPGLNHLFQKCETGMIDEYGKIEETISPEVLRKIGEWLDLFVNSN